MDIKIIAALAENQVIGCKNSLPWHLPADLLHFKNLTLHQTVVMGRKTYESLKNPLPKRTNIIITRQPNYNAPGCQIFSSLQELIEQYTSDSLSIFIIGGAEIYAQALPLASHLFLTFIDAEIKGDTFFPKINFDEWIETSRENHFYDKKNPYNYSFVNYQRISR